jgi:hypothetical protein
MEDVTFFEKKVTKKTFAPAGAGDGGAVNRRRRWRLQALLSPAPAVGLFFKKALPGSRTLTASAGDAYLRENSTAWQTVLPPASGPQLDFIRKPSQETKQ